MTFELQAERILQLNLKLASASWAQSAVTRCYAWPNRSLDSLHKRESEDEFGFTYFENVVGNTFHSEC